MNGALRCSCGGIGFRDFGTLDVVKGVVVHQYLIEGGAQYSLCHSYWQKQKQK